MNLLNVNLDALSIATNDGFRGLIRDAKSSGKWQPITDKSGNRNCLTRYAGKNVALYGQNSSLEKIKEEVEKMPLPSDHVTLLIGAGLGHLCHALLKQMEPGHVVVLIEPDPELLRYMFSEYDFSDYLTKGDLVIACPGKDEVQYALNMVDSRNVPQGWQIILEHYVPSMNNLYEEITQFTSRALNSIRCNVGTVMGAGGLLALNDILNLPYCFYRPGVNALQDLAKGKSAVIVSTGPSLSKNIHLLRKAQGKVVIIAVAQAIRPLLAYGIRPDFACTVDYGRVNQDHFEGLWDCGIPLVALNKTWAPILSKWQGPVYVMASNGGPEDSGAGLLNDKGALEQGGSVSHSALGLAILLGCAKITLIGQDLAYEGTLSHIPLADASGSVVQGPEGDLRWTVTDGRSSIANESKETKETNGYSMGESVEVPAYFGGMVQTNQGLLSFISAFEIIIKKHPGIQFFNSTEGGANIQGMRPMLLIDFLNKHKSRVHFNLDYREDFTKTKTIYSVLIDEYDELKQIIANAEKALVENDRIIKYQSDIERYAKALKKNEELSNSAHELAKKNPLVGIHIYHASRMLYRKDFKQKMDYNKPVKSILKLKCQKNRMILEAAIHACKELIPAYARTINRIRRFDKSKDMKWLKIKTKENNSITVIRDQWENDLSRGNWGRPLLETEAMIHHGSVVLYVYSVNKKAKQMRDAAIKEAKKRPIAKLRKQIESLNCLNDAHVFGRNKEFDKALVLIKRAYKIQPSALALWGWAVTEAELKNNDNALRLYKKLRTMEYGRYDSPRYEFEELLVRIRSGNMTDIDDMTDFIFKQKESKNGEQFFWIAEHLGDLYIKSKQWEKANELYKIAIAQDTLNEVLSKKIEEINEVILTKNTIANAPK